MKKITLKAKPHNKSIDHGPKVDVSQLLGPFPGNTTPSRPGIYQRESYRTPGRRLWSYWTGRTWGLMGTDFRRAISRKDRPSKSQSQPWFGIKAPNTGSAKAK
jgi:hypothetical protein